MNTKKYIQKGAIKSLVLFSFLLPLPIGTSFSSICFGVLTSLAFLHFLLNIKRIKLEYFYLLLTIPFIIYLFGLVNSDNLTYGIKFIFRNISILLFPFIFLVLKPLSIPYHKIFKAFILGSFISSSYLIGLFFYYFNIGTKFYMIVTLEIFHATYLGMYLLFSSLTSYYFFKKNKNKFYLLLSLFFLTSSIVTSSRIIIITSVFLLIFLLYKEFNGKPISYLIILIVLSVSSIVVLSVPSIKGKFIQFVQLEKIGFDKNNYHSLSSRFGKIEASLNLIKKNPYFGTGTGDLYDDLLNEYKSLEFTLGIKNKYNSHNQFLENIARNGIVGGGTALVLLYFFPFYIAKKSKNHLLLGFIFTISAVSLTESILVVQRGITFYAFFVNLLFVFGTRNILKRNLNEIKD